MKRKQFLICLIFLVFLIILPIFYFSQMIIYNFQELGADSNTTLYVSSEGDPVVTAIDDQESHQMVYAGSGSAIFVWLDSRGTSYADIYAQMINLTGDPVWAADGIPVCLRDLYKDPPQICTDGDEGAIVVWDEYSKLYAQRIDHDGQTLWQTDGVLIAQGSHSIYYPEVISDGVGGAIIAWQFLHSGGETEIFAQRINSTGHYQWGLSGVLVFNRTMGTNLHPHLVSDGNEGAIIASENSLSHLIWVQHVNSNGIPQWQHNGVYPEFTQSYYPDLASDGNGGVIIAYEDHTTYTKIYASLMNESGMTVWTTEVGFELYQECLRPVILANDGGAHIVWKQKPPLESEHNLYAQSINSSGVLQWESSAPVSEAAGDQKNPSICTDGKKGLFVAWEDYRLGHADIYANHINSSGYVLWDDGLARCTLSSTQKNPKIIKTVYKSAMIGWEDNRAGDYDIYFRTFSAYGLGDISGFDFMVVLITLFAIIFVITPLTKKRVY